MTGDLGVQELKRDSTHPLRRAPSVLRRAVAAFVPSVLALANAPAFADTYVVTACSAAPGHVNRSWMVTNTNSAKLHTSSGCGAAGIDGGLVAKDVVGTSGTGSGAHAYWSFSAPAGTTIGALSYERQLFTRNDPGWLAQLRTADGTPLEDCSDAAVGDATCSKGDKGSTVAFSTSGTARLDFGLWCEAGCVNGGTLQAARAVLYGARVTVSDPTAPVVSDVGGAGTAGGWLRGSQAVSFGVSDVGGGVKALRVAVDGVVRKTAAEACDYTLPAPCSLGSVAWGGGALDTTVLSDGAHQLRAEATDASDAVGRSEAVAIKVDNNAPQSWTIAADRSESAETRRVVSLYPAPVADSGSPVVARRFRVCRVGGSSCVVSKDLNLNVREVVVDLPADGTWVARTWDRDAAGNESPELASETTMVLDRTPAPAPALPAAPGPGPGPAQDNTGPGGGNPVLTTPRVGPAGPRALTAGLKVTTLKRTKAGLRVAGSLARGARAVRIQVRVRGTHKTLNATAAVRRGRWSVTVRVPARVAKRLRGARVTVTTNATGEVAAASVTRSVR